MRTFLLLAILAFITSACSSDNTSDASAVETPLAEDLTTIRTAGLAGIQPGTPITDYNDRTIKGSITNGEGKFQVYFFDVGDKARAAYFLTDPVNDALVGDIVVKHASLTTAQGVHIGSTYGDLVAEFADLEVHGSEAEGRVYANTGKLKFRLKTYNKSFDMSDIEISPKTAITEIIIGR